MPADIDLLIPGFRVSVALLLNECKKKGIKMIPKETLRSPFIQAKYWKQSRPQDEITATIYELHNKRAHFLAFCLEVAPKVKGPRITNALPGFSWHQWGEAIDCVWKVAGKPIWDDTILIDGKNGYQIYATEAKKLNMDAGFFWQSIKDSAHVQQKKAGSPADLYSLAEINLMMKNRFPSAEYVSCYGED